MKISAVPAAALGALSLIVVLGGTVSASAAASKAPPVDKAAAGPKSLGSFKAWQAFVREEAGGKVCYMAAGVEKSSLNLARRSPAFLIITHRTAPRSTDVTSIKAGYPVSKDKDATVQVGSKSFAMQAEGDTFWAREAATDHALAAAIRQGGSFTVTFTTAKGPVTDSYALAGADQAYKAISAACSGK